MPTWELQFTGTPILPKATSPKLFHSLEAWEFFTDSEKNQGRLLKKSLISTFCLVQFLSVSQGRKYKFL
jgi:hypothetical protein